MSSHVENALLIAQRLISELHESDPGNATFQQRGLLDGHHIVREFIKHGEVGWALEHLLYMIHESDIAYPRETMLGLHEFARKTGVKNYYSKENLKTLKREQREHVFNAP